MRQMTVVCDICERATRYEPPRVHLPNERDWMTVVLKRPPSDLVLDICPICQHRIYTANTYTGLIAAISNHHSQQRECKHADENRMD